MKSMKLDWNKKYTTIAVYACIVIVFGVACVAAALNIGQIWRGFRGLMRILNPVFYGFVIAFLINPVYRLFERKVFKFIKPDKPQDILRRVLALISAYLVVFFAITVFILIVMPQIAESCLDLESRMSGYVAGVQGLVDSTVGVMTNKEGPFAWLFQYVDVQEMSNSIKNTISELSGALVGAIPYLANTVTRFVSVLKDSLLGLVISIYFLYSRDKLCAQIKKVTYAVFKKEKGDSIIHVTRFTGYKFESFIVGKIIDSIIIGILTFFVLVIFGIPYPALIAVIVGVTNVIPFFGPFIGAIPSAFIIFIAEPIKALWFVIIILVIQQLDGNVIGPAILGDRTGLSALWIIISILVMGGLLGVAGWVIGVPLFAVVYTFFASFINKTLEKNGMSTDTIEYYRPPSDDPHEGHRDRTPGRIELFLKKQINDLKSRIKSKNNQKKK